MNVELAKLVYKQITTFPDTFDMRTWGIPEPCGTTACLAGHALLQHGGYHLEKRHDVQVFQYAVSRTGVRSYLDTTARTAWVLVRDEDGSMVQDPEQEALALLELTPEEYYPDDAAMPLFFTTPGDAIDRLACLIKDSE